MIANVNPANLSRRWFEMRHHPVVAEAYACKSRFQLYRSGRRSYKSEICKRRGVMELPMPGKFGPRKIAYIGPTANKAIDVFWDDLLTLIPKEWMRGYSKSRHEIYSIFGSMIKVGGAADIEGKPWDSIYVTESADVPPSTISIVVMPALADTGGNLTREGVPKRKGRGAKDYNRAFEFARKNRTFLGTDIEARAFSWASSAVLSEKELSIQRAILDEKDYREQFEATIESASGCVFHAWGADNIRECLYYPELPIVLGMDFNVSPMCWILAHVIDGNFCVFDELKIDDTHTQECLDKLVSIYGRHQAGWNIYGDASSASRHASTPITSYAIVANESRLLNASVFFPKGNPGVADRNAAVNRKMRNANGFASLFVDPKCVGLIEDIEYLAYDERGKPDDQGGKVGHMCDALGYPVDAIWPVMLEGQAGTSRVAAM